VPTQDHEKCLLGCYNLTTADDLPTIRDPPFAIAQVLRMPAPPYRIVMLGTGDFALPTFRHLLDEAFNVVALVTQPDRPQGRRQELIPSRIKVVAMERGVPVLQPEDVNTAEAIQTIQALRLDVLVTAAYGQILSPELLGVARLGGINLHGSILPAYRGAAPVARAIEQGATETGVTVIQMTPRIDAGGMLAVARTPIGPDETAGELEDRLAVIGAPLVADVLRQLAEGRAQVRPQDRAQVSRAPKLRKEDGRIDWSRPAAAIHNKVRAMQPWPLAETFWHAPGAATPLRLIVHQTAVVEGTGAPGRLAARDAGRLVVFAGSGAVELRVVQVPGKRPMPVEEFLRGNRLDPAGQFGGPDASG
jgi:methionyl-tRNA formyltransferase